MRRTNGILVGSILVFLFAGVLFLQSRTDPFAGPAEETAANQPAAPVDDAPGVKDLQKQIADQNAKAEGAVPLIPANEKFKPDNTFNTLPADRWYDGAKTPQTADENVEKAPKTPPKKSR